MTISTESILSLSTEALAAIVATTQPDGKFATELRVARKELARRKKAEDTAMTYNAHCAGPF